MKKLLAAITALLLSACVSVPVDRTFPKTTADQMVPCQDLKTIDPTTTKLSTVVDTITTNYGQYQECQVKVNSWIEWYNTQKQIFDSVK